MTDEREAARLHGLPLSATHSCSTAAPFRDEGQEWVVHSIYKTKYTDEHDSELEDNFVYYYNANDWDSADGEFPEEDEGLLECSVMSEFEAFAQWI